jgi:hypothetical protein
MQKTALKAVFCCSLTIIFSRSVRSNLLTGRKNKKPATRAGFDVFGGSCEIRTHGRLSPSPVFKTGAFNRSAKLPSPQL